MNNTEHLLEIAKKKLKDFKISSLNFVKASDSEFLISVSVDKLIEDLPNSIEIEGKNYYIDQSISRIKLLDATELDIDGVTKAEGERLQKWRSKVQGENLRAIIFENDCNAGNDGTEYPDATVNKTKTRPLKCGVSISADKTTHGTLGCFAIDNQDGKLVGVTNAHTLAERFLLTSESDETGYEASVENTKVYQGDMSNLSALTDDDAIGIVKRYFPVGLPYATRNGGHKITKDQYQIDAGLIAIKKGMVDENSWKLAGIDNNSFNGGGAPTFASYNEHLNWVYDSFWGGYTSDVGGGTDEFKTPQESDMLTSGAGSGPKDGTKTGDDEYRWRIIGPYKFQEQAFNNSKNPDATIIKFSANNVAVARQQTKDRYQSDGQETIARGDWYCADNLIPGDSGSVLYANIRGKWKMVGLIYATKFEHPTPETITYKEGLIIPFYLIAELLDISPWDGIVSDDIFSYAGGGEIRTDLIYTKGKSDIYRHEVPHRLGKKAYFQIGSVKRKNNREYTAVQESFSSGGGEIAPIQRNISDFITYESIDIDLPTEGSFDVTNRKYQSDPVWFKVNKLDVPNSTIPANILDPGDGVVTLDVAIIKGESFEGLSRDYFKKENRGKLIYASAPILEFYGSTINSSGTTIDNIASKVRDLLGGANNNYELGKQFTNLSKIRFENGRKGSQITVSSSGLDLKDTTGYVEHFPWDTGAGNLKGGAKASPEKLEDWISEGAKKCLVLTYIDKDSEYIIDKVDLGDIETDQLGTFPVESNEVSTGDKIMRFDIDTSKYVSDLSVLHNGSNGSDYTGYHWENEDGKAAKTVMMPILETGPEGATIDWGDGTTSQVPANWKMRNYNELVACWKNLKAGATTNTTHSEVHQDLGYDKIVHFYQTAGVKAITINGDVLRFGNVGSFQDEAVTAGGASFPASEKGWKAGHGQDLYGGLSSGIFYQYCLMFSCRVTYIHKFPNWKDCDFIYAFVLSNITGWDENSEFAGFRSIGAFVTHIKKLNGEWVSEGFSDFSNGDIGPFDNWKFGKNYSEDFDFFKIEQYREGEDGFGVKDDIPYESLYHTFNGIHIDSNPAIKGMASQWKYHSTYTDEKFEGFSQAELNSIFASARQPYSKIIGNIRFNHDLKIGGSNANPASINQEPFYNYICNQVDKSGKQVNVKYLKLENYKSFNKSVGSDASGKPSKSYDWMSRSNVFFMPNGGIDFASGTLPKYSVIKSLLVEDKGYALTSSKGVDSIENVFESERINAGNLTAFIELFTLKGSCSYKQAFKNAIFTTAMDFSEFNFAGCDLTEIFKSVTAGGDITLPSIEQPTSIQGWFEDATINNGTIKGLSGLSTSIKTDIRNAFLNLKIDSNITDLPKLKLSEGQIFDLITSKCEALRDGLGDVNPSAFRVKSDSVGSVTMPANLTFVNEIVDYVRMTPSPVNHSTQSSILDDEYSVAINKEYANSSRNGWSGNQIKPSFAVAGKYAILVDSSWGTTYTPTAAIATSNQNSWASVYNSNLSLGLYESTAGYWTKNDKSLIGGNEFFGNDANDSVEITSTEFINKFKAMALSSDEYYWYPGALNSTDYNKNVLSNSFSCRTLFESVGRHSYWAVITVDKTKYQKPDLHLRFKNENFTTKDWTEITVEPFKYAHNMLHAAAWNGGSTGAPRSLLSDQKGKFWSNEEELLGVGELATRDVDGDGILDIDEVGDDITDPDTGDSKITITYADHAKYTAIASVNHEELGYVPEGHEIASNKVGVSLQIGAGGITIDWGDSNDPVSYDSTQSGVIAKDYGSTGGEKTIIIEGDVTCFGSGVNHNAGGSYDYGSHTTTSSTDQNIRVFLGSQFRMKAFKYEGGGKLLNLGAIFKIGSYTSIHHSKTMYDPTNIWAAANTSLPESNCQVSVDLSGFKPYSINNFQSAFSHLYTHDLDLSSLDFSKVVDMSYMFGNAIITGNLKMPKVDDSSPSMPDSRYFNERQDTFSAHTTRIQALKDAHAKGKYKRLDWGGAPLKALEDDPETYTSESSILSQIKNCYRSCYYLFHGSVINEITFGEFKPIFTSAEDYGWIMGAGSSYINKMDGSIAEQFPKSSMGPNASGLLLAPVTKDVNMTLAFLSIGKIDGESAWTGPYDRTITYEFSLKKDNLPIEIGSANIEVTVENPRSVPMITESVLFENDGGNVRLRLSKGNTFEEESINNLREAEVIISMLNEPKSISIKERGFNSYGGNTFIEYEMGNTTTIQQLINFINGGSDLVAEVLQGADTSALVTPDPNDDPSYRFRFYRHRRMQREYTGVDGGITVDETYMYGYRTLRWTMGNGSTPQQLINAINNLGTEYKASLVQGNASSLEASEAGVNVPINYSQNSRGSTFSNDSENLFSKGGIDHVALGYENYGNWRYLNNYYERFAPNSTINVFPDNDYVFDWSGTDIPIKFSLTDGGEEWADPNSNIIVDNTSKTTTLKIDDKFPSHFNGNNYNPQGQIVLYGYAEGKPSFTLRIYYVNTRSMAWKGENPWENFGYSSKPSISPFNTINHTFSKSSWLSGNGLQIKLVAGLRYIIDYSALDENSEYDKLQLIGTNSSSDTQLNTRTQEFDYFTSNQNKKLTIDLRDMTEGDFANPTNSISSSMISENGIIWGKGGLGLGSIKFNTSSSLSLHSPIYFEMGPQVQGASMPDNAGRSDDNRLTYAVKDAWFYGLLGGTNYSSIKNVATINNWIKPGGRFKNPSALARNFKYENYTNAVSMLFAGMNNLYKYNDDGTIQQQRAPRVSNVWGQEFGEDSYGYVYPNNELTGAIDAKEAKYRNSQCGIIDSVLKLKTFKYSNLTSFDDWAEKYPEKAPQ